MEPKSKKILKIFLIGLSFLVLVSIFSLLKYIYGDHELILLKGYREFFSSDPNVISADSLSTTYNLILARDGLPDLNCYLRIPADADNSPVLVLLGGLNSGKDVIKLAGDTDIANKLVIMCMDYPYEGKKRKVPIVEVISAIPDIRKAIFDTVSSIKIMIDYLETRPEINRDQIFLAGGSFGSFFAITAGALDRRVKAVISLYGGGDIALLISEDLKWEPKFLRKLTGYTIALLTLPVEPLNWVDKISPRQFLMINGKDDERIAIESVSKLYDKAKEPKELLWHNSKHIRPTAGELTMELTEIIGDWLLNKGLIDR